MPEILGWSDAYVLHWISQHWATFLERPDDLFYNQPPQYWAAPYMIPEGLKARLSSSELVVVRQQIVAAFDDNHHFDFPIDTDWSPYRNKIDAILSHYGMHLPTGNEDS